MPRWRCGTSRPASRICVQLRFQPSNDTQVSVRTLWSGISRGTERLVASGRVPVAEYERMRAPMQEGTFPFPVKYGYCAVGIVEDGPGELAGKTVFALHPHQDQFRAPASMSCRCQRRFQRVEASSPPTWRLR